MEIKIWHESTKLLSVGWLFNGTSTQKGKFVPTAGGGKPAQSAKDGQRDTMHITLRYTITM